MGRLKNGIFGPVTGKVDNIVCYKLNEQNVVRTIGISNKPRTKKQLNNHQQMKVIMKFFAGMDALLKTGFDPLAKGTVKNYYNLAISYNKPHALKGSYPNVEIDYSKIVISAGDLPPAASPAIEMTEEGLKFSWNAEGLSWPENVDRAMLLAYAPATNEMRFKYSGAKRIAGYDVLEIPPSMRNELLETYISFVSDDRLKAANSSYTGNIRI